MSQSLDEITEFHPATSWQGRMAANALRTFVKPVVARVPLTRRVMKFSQLGFDTVTLVLPVHPDVHIAPADVGGVPGAANTHAYVFIIMEMSKSANK